MSITRRNQSEQSIALRDYRRALALYCTAMATAPHTAGEIAEFMQSIAEGDGHPVACWSGLNAQSVAGYLRALESKGQVKQEGERKNTTNGRGEPLWVSVVMTEPRLPDPPEHDAAPPPALNPTAAAGPYTQMTRPQLLAVLHVTDQLGGAVARFLRDIQDVNERARRELAAVGIEVGGE